MFVSTKKIGWRAAVWATAITGGALITTWLPRIIWPSRESPNVVGLIFMTPGFVLLLPGIMITSFVRLIAYELFHHAEIARQIAAHPAETGGTYFVVSGVGLAWSIPFLCAIVLNWLFYFLIARQALKARAQRQNNADRRKPLGAPG